MSNNINGLRLVSPEEAGYENKDNINRTVRAVVLFDGLPKRYFHESSCLDSSIDYLLPLPKPRTIRPYRRGEVKCGDVFRRKACGHDYLVTRVCNENVFLGGDYGETTCKVLLDQFQKLTYDSKGREVLECAGKVEESQ